MFLAALSTLWGLGKGVYRLLPPKDWLIVLALTLIVGYHLYAVHEAHLQGFEEAQAVCAKREAAAIVEHDRQLKALDTKYRGMEQQQATALAVAGENYATQLQSLEEQRKRDVSRARSGALIVRVPGACTPSDRPAPESPAPAPGSDGPQGCQLSTAAGGNLLDLIADADRNTQQLSACQAVITTYLKGQP